MQGWKRILNPGKIHKHVGKIYENVSKIPEILGNLPENTDKNGYQRYLILKNWRRTWRPFFLEVIPKITSVGGNTHTKSCPKTFRASLGKFGQKSFAPPKICLFHRNLRSIPDSDPNRFTGSCRIRINPDPVQTWAQSILIKRSRAPTSDFNHPKQWILSKRWDKAFKSTVTGVHF